MIRHTTALAVAALAAAQLAPAPAAAQQEVVVYSSRSHYGAEKVFEDFTRETGIQIRFFRFGLGKEPRAARDGR